MNAGERLEWKRIIVDSVREALATEKPSDGAPCSDRRRNNMNDAKPTCGFNEAKPYQPTGGDPTVRSTCLTGLIGGSLTIDDLRKMGELVRAWDAP